MKLLRVALIVLTLLFSHIFYFYIPAYAVAPADLVSQAAVLMDMDTGQVIYDKDMTLKMYPASMTKILTALLVLENCRPYEIATVSQSAVSEIYSDHSQIALVPGEELSVNDALYALMLPSANDAANVLAEHVAGTLEKFTDMMNEKAREIGAVHSNFANAHGYHDDNHYTTAYDMALITRYAMQNELFRQYFGSGRSYTMPATNLKPERYLVNYQYNMQNGPYYNPDVVGGKVGFTNEAQNTMSSVAVRDGRSLVCVVMQSPARGDKFRDTDKLLKFGFEEFVPVSVSVDLFSGLEFPVKEDSRTVGSAIFTASRDFTALIHNTADPEKINIRFDHPEVMERNGPIICKAVFELPETSGFIPQTLGAVQLDADLNFPIIPELPQDNAKQAHIPAFLLYVGVSLGGVLGLCLIFKIYRKYQIRKRRRLRKERLDRRMRDLGLSVSASYLSRPYQSSRSHEYISAVSRPPVSRQKIAK